MTMQTGAAQINSSPVSLGQILLFQILGANFQITTDQPLIKLYPGSAYIITGVYGRQRSGAASIACLGGIYDAASKGGNAVVAATQSWVTLGSGIIVSASLASLVNTTLLTNSLILSLTTGSTAACTADVLVFGIDVS